MKLIFLNFVREAIIFLFFKRLIFLEINILTTKYEKYSIAKDFLGKRPIKSAQYLGDIIETFK